MGWYEAIKDAVTAAEKLRSAELKQKMADVQVECAKLAEENAHLRQELIGLREQAQTRQDMQYRDNVYWRQFPDGKQEGPFCPKCLDGDSKAARMSNRPGDSCWRCPVCNYFIQKQGPDSSAYETEVVTDFDPFAH